MIVLAAMLTIEFLLRFFDRGFVIRTLLQILLLSLIPIAEVLLLFRLGTIVGEYLVLAVVASTGLVGLLLALSRFGRSLRVVRKKVRDGEYPAKEFNRLAGGLFAGLLLVLPGFFTDVFGLLLFVPLLRSGVGHLITQRIEPQLREAYEYLKMYESW